MTVHARNLIRDAVAQALTDAPAITQTVYPSRVRSIAPDSLLVYTVDETSERDSMGPNGGTLRRELTLQVVGIVAASADFDDLTDTLTADVEEVLGPDPTLGGLAKDLFLNTTEIELVGDGEKPVGTVTMGFIVEYVTTAADPSTTL